MQFDHPDRIETTVAKRLEMTQTARDLRKRSTPSETILWEALRGRKLVGVRFRRQHPVGPFVVDFFAAKEKLAVEIDGSVHDETVEADADRQAIIEGAGYRFVRVSAEMVEKELPKVLELIRKAAGK